jgi:hypothetical protein
MANNHRQCQIRSASIYCTVIKLSHSDFRDWKTVGNKLNVTLSSNEKLKVSEIRIAIFEKSLIQKNNFKVIFNARNPEEVVATIKPKRNQGFIEPSPQYCNPLPISTKKFQDLVNLCCSKHGIPEHFHKEYLNLPHSNTVRDALIEPDEEEEDAVI